MARLTFHCDETGRPRMAFRCSEPRMVFRGGRGNKGDPGTNYLTQQQATALTDGGVTNLHRHADASQGDMTGPSGAPDGAVLLSDGTTGKAAKAGPTIGTGASQLVQLNAQAELPAVSAKNLTDLPATGEPPLGSPTADGDVLASTKAGVRSWVALFTKAAADLLYAVAGHKHAWGDLTSGVPSTFPPVIGTGATDAMAGNTVIPSVSGKADKAVPAAAGNFAALDAGGNLSDSGKKTADFATAAQGTDARTPTTHGNDKHGAAYITANDLPTPPASDPAANVAGLRTLGNGATQAMPGNTTIPAALPAMSQAQAEAGTDTTERSITAQRIAQAIAALVTGGMTADQLARLTVDEQRIALLTGDLMAHTGAGDQQWLQAFIDAMQDNTGMAVPTGAYYNSVSRCWSTVTPASTNVAVNATASDSNEYGGYPASNANDGNGGTMWLAGANYSNIWLALDFGVGNTQNVTKYAIVTGYNLADTDMAWTFQGSNNGSSWTQLDYQNTTGWSYSERREYALAASASYRYYRLLFASGSGGPYGYAITEFQLYGASVTNITLRTVTTATSASPTHGSLLAVCQELDAVTLNTDVVAKIGKNGTTGIVTLALAKIATIGAYAIYFGEADYASGTGVTMQAELDTANTKAWELYRLYHSWR